VPVREQVVDDLEALLAAGVIGAAQIHEADEQTMRIISQDGEHANNGVALDQDREFAIGDGSVEYRAAERCCDVLAECVQIERHFMNLFIAQSS